MCLWWKISYYNHIQQSFVSWAKAAMKFLTSAPAESSFNFDSFIHSLHYLKSQPLKSVGSLSDVLLSSPSNKLFPWLFF